MKKEVNAGCICGGRSAGRTYAQFKMMYEKARKEGYTDVNFHFVEPYTDKLEKENKRQQKIINRLSRKIQRLKGISFKDKEITLLLYCIDLVIQKFGYNQELEKIYARLYRQRKEAMDREKKGF